MEFDRIDHVNLRIPEDGLEEPVNFYQDKLGFQPEKLELFKKGERTSFAFRLNEKSMLHIRPVENFEPPKGNNYDHLCLVIKKDVQKLKKKLSQKDVEIIREGDPWGASGRAPAVYIKDPLGYTLELKEET